MIVIDDVIVSDDLLQNEFVCNLSKCKGACCVQGDGGAPLAPEEIDLLPNIYEAVKPYLTPEGIEQIETHGFTNQEEGENYRSTPLRKSDSACVYVNFSEDGTTYCGIEKAHLDGKIEFRKPVSCHLYPVRVKEYEGFQAVNYHQWDICSDACTLGKELKVPLYQFVKEPLIRKFGEAFYDALHATATHLQEEE